MKNNLVVITLLLFSCQNQATKPNSSVVSDYRDAFTGYYSFTTEYITESFYTDTIVSHSTGRIQKSTNPKQILIIIDTSAIAIKKDTSAVNPENSFELYLSDNGDLKKDSTTFPFKNEVVGNINNGKISFKGFYNTWATGTSRNHHHGEKMKL